MLGVTNLHRGHAVPLLQKGLQDKVREPHKVNQQIGREVGKCKSKLPGPRSCPPCPSHCRGRTEPSEHFPGPSLPLSHAG